MSSEGEEWQNYRMLILATLERIEGELGTILVRVGNMERDNAGRDGAEIPHRLKDLEAATNKLSTALEVLTVKVLLIGAGISGLVTFLANLAFWYMTGGE